MKNCKMLACEKKVVAKNLCAAHYRRYMLYGDPSIKKLQQSSGLTVSERFWKYVIQRGKEECWPWVGNCHRQGYGQICVCLEPKKYKTVLAHRLSWEIHNGDIPSSKSVLHKCDNPNCVNPDHLFLGSQYDNVRDMHDKKRDRKRGRPGEENSASKITEDQVQEIRKSDLKSMELAEKFNITRGQVWNIQTGKSWRHVK